MTQFSNLFVVYDPTQEAQPALDRAAIIAEANAAALHVFSCIFSETVKSSGQSADIKHYIAEAQSQLDSAVASVVARGIPVSTEVEWDKDWYQAVVRASTKNAADMVLKSSYKHSPGTRILNRTSDWTLIRGCLCPVLLVKGRKPREIPRVLAAIDINARKSSYERLNQRVVSVAKEILARETMEVHIVNAFTDFKAVPDRQELVRICGVESTNIHIKNGDPEKVIVAQAKALDVSLVVVGNSARSGLAAALHGNTVEKMLDKLRCDVLTMP